MKKTRLVLFAIAFVFVFSLPISSAVSQTPTCPPNPTVQEILNQVTQASVTQWVRNFSGEDFVQVGTSQRKILTRYSSQLFNLNVNALAYPYLGEQLSSFGYEAGTFQTDHVYSPYHALLSKEITVSDWLTKNTDDLYPRRESIDLPDQTLSWKNKVVTIPGHGPNADEIVLITAHMDNTSTAPSTNAPGAEDNASGIAALMEAARLFRFYKFDRTIKIIFFTGEEQGLLGSEAYVADNSSEMGNIVGVVNLDMFGYDNDNDGCFELHVGTRSNSNVVGTCFTNVIANYNLDLTYDYITNGAIPYSDHASFWYANVGAIEVLENSYVHTGLGCGEIIDENPYYHTTNDKIASMNLPVTLKISQAGIGTAASLALPMGRCFTANPVVTATPQADSILLNWPELAGADVYNVYRSSTTCGGTFTQVAQVTTSTYEDTNIEFDKYYFYKIQAAESGAVCFSQFSNCAVAKVEEPVYFSIFIPLVISGD